MPLTLGSSVRSLLRSPAFTAAAILTVALGVGVNAAIFSAVYGVLIEPLPFRDPERLVRLWETHPQFANLQVTIPDFRDWQEPEGAFEELSAYTRQSMNKATLVEPGRAQQVQAVMSSWRLFGMLGVRPLAGRDFTREDEARQGRVLLMNERLWRERYGADPAIIGRSVRLGPQSFVVVGIVPREQAMPAWADLWMPLSLAEPQLQSSRVFHPLEVIGRLKPGVTVNEAQAHVQTIAAHLAAEYPVTNGRIGAVVVPLLADMTGAVRPALLAIWGAVSLVLLIACANVAHLVMARSRARAVETAIRSALGAGAVRLVAHVLSEALLLSFAGGAVGLAFAFCALQIIRPIAGAEIPRFENVGLNAPVFLWTLGAALLTGILFALPACRQVVHTQPGRQFGSARSATPATRPGRALIAAELALSMLIVSGAILLVRSFALVLSVNPGFEAHGVLNVSLSPPLETPDWEKASTFFYERIAPAINGLPGVESVASANSAPMSLGPTEQDRFATRFAIPGVQYSAGSYPVAQLRWVAGDYFQTLGIALIRGRLIDQRDKNKSICVINQEFAKRFFPGEDPVGKRFLLGVMGLSPQPEEVVGVVANVRELGLERAVPPMFYRSSVSPYIELLVRTSREANAAAPAVVRALRMLDPELAVNRVRTMDAIVAESLARRRFALDLMTAFAALAIVLAAIGIYGIAAYSAVLRTREFAIRTAVGATRADLYRLALRNNLAAVAGGLIAGAALSFLSGYALRPLLYAVAPGDPASMIAAAGLLCAVAFASGLIPLARMLRADAWSSLRAE